MSEEPLYQPVELPDYEGRAVLQPCIERWQLMQDWLPTKQGRMLDLGCHTGWFCRKFASAGWQAFGIDRSEDWIKLAQAQDPAGNYVVEDIFNVAFTKFDVILCLSLAMYLFENIAEGWQLLRRISQSAPLMFMDFGGMYSHRMPFDELTVIPKMLEHTDYRAGLLIGHTDFEQRPFFIFEK